MRRSVVSLAKCKLHPASRRVVESIIVASQRSSIVQKATYDVPNSTRLAGSVADQWITVRLQNARLSYNLDCANLPKNQKPLEPRKSIFYSSSITIIYQTSKSVAYNECEDTAGNLE